MKRLKLDLDQLSKELGTLDSEHLAKIKGGYGNYGQGSGGYGGYNSWEELFNAMQHGYIPPAGTYDPNGGAGGYGGGYGGYNGGWPGWYPLDGGYGPYDPSGGYGGYGGYGMFNGRMDCVFRSVSFVTGLSVEQVQNEYVTFYNKVVDALGWNPIWHVSFDQVGVGGVPYDQLDSFLRQYNILSGYATSAPYGSSGITSQGVITIPGHAYNITGMINPFSYATYDSQTGQTGSISIDDPRIIGVYSINGAYP